MRWNYFTICLILCTALFIVELCHSASFLDFEFDKSDLYTPGTITLKIYSPQRLTLQGKYILQIGYYFNNTLLNEQIQPYDIHEESLEITITCPPVYQKNRIHCRVELWLNNTPIEAKEKTFTAWPSPPTTPLNLIGKTIGAYDPTCILHNRLKSLNIEYFDANYFLIQEYIIPDLLIIGENVDPNACRLLMDRIKKYDDFPILIFLHQYSFPPSIKGVLSANKGNFNIIKMNLESSLLVGLDQFDFLDIYDFRDDVLEISQDQYHNINHAIAIDQNKQMEIQHLLVSTHDDKQHIILCQIPILKENPRNDYLLWNILNYATTLSGNKNI